MDRCICRWPLLQPCTFCNQGTCARLTPKLCSQRSLPFPMSFPTDKYSSSAKLLRAYGRFLEVRGALLPAALVESSCNAASAVLPFPMPPWLSYRTCAATRGWLCATMPRRTDWRWSHERWHRVHLPSGGQLAGQGALIKGSGLGSHCWQASSCLTAKPCAVGWLNRAIPLPPLTCREGGDGDRSLNQMVDDSADAVVVRWGGGSRVVVSGWGQAGGTAGWHQTCRCCRGLPTGFTCPTLSRCLPTLPTAMMWASSSLW